MASLRSGFGLVALLLVALQCSIVNVAAMEWQSGWSALVTGSVFCDQCVKQEVFPFGLPLKGGLARACFLARPSPCSTMLSALQCPVLVLALQCSQLYNVMYWSPLDNAVNSTMSCL